MRVLLILVFFASFISGQQDTLKGYLFEYSPDYYSEYEGEAESEFAVHLQYYINNPVNINTAGLAQLMELPFITSDIALALLNYRNKNKVISIAEIYSIPDISYAYKPVLMKMLKVNDEINKEFKPVNNKLILSTYAATGTENTIFDYDGAKYYNKLNYFGNNYRLNLITEKDSEEKIYPDFYSLSAHVKGILPKTDVYVGDFKIYFGLGVAHYNSAFGLNGYDPFSPMKVRSRFVAQSNSRDEFNFMRGIAVKYQFNQKISVTPFYSLRKLDGQVNRFDYASVSTDGLHITDYELRTKNNFKENSFGLISRYRNQNFDAGILLKQTIYENNIQTPIGFKDAFTTGSLYAKYTFRRITFSGEGAVCNDEYSAKSNLFIRITPQLSFLTSVRYIDSRFFSFYKIPKTNKLRTEIDRGFYMGAMLKTEYGTFSTVYDLFNNSDFEDVYNNSWGKELRILFHSKQFTNYRFNLRTRYKETTDRSFRKNKMRILTSYRGELLYSPSLKFANKSRIEYSNYHEWYEDYKGWLIMNEMKLSPSEKLAFFFRVAYFDCERGGLIYAYEYHPGDTFQVTQYSGKGIFWYLAANHKLFNLLNISAKYSSFMKENNDRNSTLGHFSLHLQLRY